MPLAPSTERNLPEYRSGLAWPDTADVDPRLLRSSQV